MSNTVTKGRKKTAICKNCKHWHRFEREYEDNALGSCDETDDYNTYQKGERDDIAYGCDYEGYRAGVYTGQNYGCIHFSKKMEEK